MTFEELGAILRSEREKKNINITDAANQLKINSRYLQALEEGNVSALPHPAYVRGFIRSYAKLLGLDSDEIQEMLDSFPDINKNKPKKRQFTQPPEIEEKHRSHTGLIILLILALLAGGIYYLWNEGYLDFVKQWQNSSAQQSGELQSADRFIAEKDAQKAKREEKPATIPSAENREERILPIPGNQPIPVIPKPAPALPEVRPELAETKIPEQIAAPLIKEEAVAVQENTDPVSSSHHKLIITAIEECWIHSNADKTDTRQFSLRKGDTFALTFADSLELKLGNAGGVRLRYDGSDLPPPGNSGQVRTLVFPLKNNS